MWLYRRPAQCAVAGMCAVIFGLLGAILLGTASGLYEHVISYRTADTHATFTVNADVVGPILVSYDIPRMYVNHKGYIESKDNFILSGGFMGKYTCEGAEDLADVRRRRCQGDANCSHDGVFKRAERTGALRPCGLVSLSMFTDRYELVRLDDGSSVSLDQRNVAFERDEDIFKDKVLPAPDGALADFTVEGTPSWLEKGDFYEHFKVWHRTPASPHVRNLWAKITGPLRAGRYELRFVENDAVWTDFWIDMEAPEKRVVISQAHQLGSAGACRFLGGICMAYCCVQVFLTFFFLALPLLSKE